MIIDKDSDFFYSLKLNLLVPEWDKHTHTHLCVCVTKYCNFGFCFFSVVLLEQFPLNNRQWIMCVWLSGFFSLVVLLIMEFLWNFPGFILCSWNSNSSFFFNFVHDQNLCQYTVDSVDLVNQTKKKKKLIGYLFIQSKRLWSIDWNNVWKFSTKKKFRCTYWSEKKISLNRGRKWKEKVSEIFLFFEKKKWQEYY